MSGRIVEITRRLYDANTYGAHGRTIRASYTVPADRIARIEHVNLNIVATIAGVAFGQVSYVAQVQTGAGVVLAQFARALNNPASPVFVETTSTCDILVRNGDVVVISTTNLSGVNVFYEGSVFITEYIA